MNQIREPTEQPLLPRGDGAKVVKSERGGGVEKRGLEIVFIELKKEGNKIFLQKKIYTFLLLDIISLLFLVSFLKDLSLSHEGEKRLRWPSGQTTKICSIAENIKFGR